MGKHMLVYHVGLPLGVLAVLMVIGVPLATALPIAVMSGCIAMVFMMGGGHGGHGGDRHDDADSRDHDDVLAGRR